jgi:ribosomal protein S18 acetylase RimI-like enzyme
MHHAKVCGDLGPMRSPAESWARRRTKYEAWLSEPDSFGVLARVDGVPIGYAVVHLCEGSESWQTSDRIVSIETMCLLPKYRQHHIGDHMAQAIFERCMELDVSHAVATAIAGNDDAVRFFERYGFMPTTVTLRLARPEVLPRFGG